MLADRLGPYDLDTIVTGDARELAKAIPDESVDLIFTDPVYDRIDDYRWLAETAARVLKPDSACLVYYGIGFLPETVAALQNLNYEWQYINYMPTLNARGAYKTFSNYRAMLCYHKGRCVPLSDMRDLQTDGFSARNNGHGWAKNLEIVAYYLEKYASPNAVVADFFTGRGTVPAVCKMLNRRYLAFEICPDTATLARERVRQTQPPLPGLVVEQAKFLLDSPP